MASFSQSITHSEQVIKMPLGFTLVFSYGALLPPLSLSLTVSEDFYACGRFFLQNILVLILQCECCYMMCHRPIGF